jgi:putative ABC transport system permease protein
MSDHGVLLQDLRFAVRSLRRRLGFTAAAVTTLALGIGATTAIFSGVYALFLGALPYPEADRLVAVWGARGSDSRILAAYSDLEDFRTRSRSFAGIGMVRGQSVNLTGGDTPARVGGEFVTAETFAVLGQRAARGRLFTPEETRPGNEAAVAVVSDRMWRGRLGGDPSVVGRTLILNGRPSVIVGVLAPGQESPFGAATDVWLPISAIPSGPVNFLRGQRNIWAVARLRPGVTVAEAQRELSALAAELAVEYPETNAGIGATVLSLRDQISGELRAPLLTLFAAVLLVLMVACANVANLQLARALSRGPELSLRVALGAGRGRLVRQLLTESLVLAIPGGCAGIWIAVFAVQALVQAMPNGLPNNTPVGLNLPVLGFSLGVTLLAAVISGLAPAWYGLHAGLAQRLKPNRSGWSVGRIDAGSALVVAELGLCLVLLVGDGLLLRSLAEMRQVRPGFEPHNLLTFQFRLPPVKYEEPERRAAFFRQAMAEVRRVPGVTSAALVSATPMSGNYGTSDYVVAERPAPAPGQVSVAQASQVSDEYFRTMQVPLLAGREFDARDGLEGVPVAIVNQELARREWPGESPIGKRLKEANDSVWLTVVGVVGDVKQLSLADEPTPQLYRPVLQAPGLFSNVVARTSGDPLEMTAPVQAAVWAVDPDQPMWAVYSMDQMLEYGMRRLRFTMVLMSVFAVMALVLAAIGVYGVTSFLANRRTREVGIRIAIGATPSQAVAPILGHGVRLIVLGSVLGVLAAAAGARLLSDQLFALNPLDPPTYLSVALGLAGVAFLACLLPIRRAARMDPMLSLRSE